MPKLVKVFYDLETTGVEVKKHSIHQIAGIIEVNGVVAEEFDIRTRPHPKALIEEGALIAGNVTKEQILGYQDMKDAHKEFKALMHKYIDPFDTTHKAWNVGFNNRFFDDQFLRAWFRQNGDNFIGSLFWADTIDVLVLASQYLIERRSGMPSFKLKRVAKELGLIVEEDKLHNGLYDVKLIREIYRIVTGLEIEI